MDPLRSANHTAITAVTVIDPWRREVTAGQTVVVGGGTISAVGGADEVPVPSNAVPVDGRGRFLIPGLWDMHVHGAADDLSLYLVSGVTGVREMGPAPAALPIRDDIVAGRLLGPRIIIGDPVDGPDSFVNRVRTAGDVVYAG